MQELLHLKLMTAECHMQLSEVCLSLLSYGITHSLSIIMIVQFAGTFNSLVPGAVNLAVYGQRSSSHLHRTNSRLQAAIGKTGTAIPHYAVTLTLTLSLVRSLVGDSFKYSVDTAANSYSTNRSPLNSIHFAPVYRDEYTFQLRCCGQGEYEQ